MNEYQAFLYKLNKAKEAYMKKPAKARFFNFLKKWKFLEEKSPYYKTDDYYANFYKNYMDKDGIYYQNKDNPEVVAIINQAETHYDATIKKPIELTPAQQKKQEFFEGVEQKKQNLSISAEKRDEIRELIKSNKDYVWKDPFKAETFLNFTPEEKWFFAYFYLESNFESISATPFVNQNYDVELPVIIKVFADKARLKILANMGIKRNPIITKKTENIMKRIELIKEAEKGYRLIDESMQFLLQNEPYQKHFFAATGLNRDWWQFAMKELYKDDEETYMKVTMLLYDNSAVGKNRITKAYKLLIPLILNGEINAYNYSLLVPDTKAGELYNYVGNNKELFPEDEAPKLMMYFYRHFQEYMEIDINEKANLTITSNAGELITGRDIYDFLYHNYMNIDLGSFNYVANYFEQYGKFPPGRTSEQIIEIKTKIESIKEEIRHIQDSFINEVLAPIEMKLGPEFKPHLT